MLGVIFWRRGKILAKYEKSVFWPFLMKCQRHPKFWPLQHFKALGGRFTFVFWPLLSELQNLVKKAVKEPFLASKNVIPQYFWQFWPWHWPSRPRVYMWIESLNNVDSSNAVTLKIGSSISSAGLALRAQPEWQENSLLNPQFFSTLGHFNPLFLYILSSIFSMKNFKKNWWLVKTSTPQSFIPCFWLTHRTSTYLLSRSS